MRDVLNSFHDALEVTDDHQAAATLVLANRIEGVIGALHRLGNADAATPMGGMEALGAVLKEGLAEIASAVS